ncbi:hypothetical protein [Streptomyces sp. NRRL S-378]|uniref:hypothetical protein n=1 Tax=Streptomyces sp. NRRL S-378 TaxID=1463904 RepID=UPI0004CAC0BF|nr:hypothetical protein [Streptomyces sp. NRRL S-378]
MLVVPCALTPSERAFAKGLGEGAERPRIRVLDRAWLDDKLALHADLEASFVRDDLREAARDYRAELAFLEGGTDDIVQRVGALGRRIIASICTGPSMSPTATVPWYRPCDQSTPVRMK